MQKPSPTALLSTISPNKNDKVDPTHGIRLGGIEMIWELLHWTSLAVAGIAAFIYFRDLGDVTQAFMTVHRKNMIFAIRNENRIITLALTCLAVAVTTFLYAQAGYAVVLVPVAIAIVIMLAFPWVWLHVGLRNQQDTATYYTINEAKKFVRPEDSVIVIENKGVARAS